MKRLTALFVLSTVAFLAGCPSMSIKDMSAEQLKATNGMLTCSQLSSMYGRGSSILVNTDDLRKGATSKGKTVITCGDASMTIESEIGAAAVPGAVTTTTTVVPARTTTTTTKTP